MNNLLPERKQMRLPVYDYSNTGYYFITACTFNRENIFGTIVNDRMVVNKIGDCVGETWNNLHIKYKEIELDSYCIMPNHVHGIIVVRGETERAIRELPLQKKSDRRNMVLSKVIGYFKMNSAKEINKIRNTKGLPVWQRNYYEHIIRNEKELQEIRNYILYNHLKWEKDSQNIIHRRRPHNAQLSASHTHEYSYTSRTDNS